MSSDTKPPKRQRTETDPDTPTESNNAEKDKPRSTKRPRIDQGRTLFVRSLPKGATSESLTEFFSNHYPVKHAVVVNDPQSKESRGYGFVTFADTEDAQAARDTLNKTKWDGQQIRVEVAEPRQRGDRKGGIAPAISEEKAKRLAAKAEALRPPKLIIRNLPWSVKTSEHLTKLFQSFGKVKYADVPGEKGKMSGFGFVTMRGRKNAEKAMEKLNGKEVDGRTIAVDWAVDKSVWEQQNKGEVDATEQDKPPTTATQSEPTELDEDKIMDDDADMDAFIKKIMPNLESESEGESDDEADHENEEDDESNEDNADDAHSAPKPERQRQTDNSTTVFVRNLPYTTTDEELKTFFTSFGPVRYARVVMDKALARPAGTGFVCFFSEPDFKSCVRDAPRPAPVSGGQKLKHSILHDEMADPSGKYTMQGRVLQVVQAISKDEATRITEEGGKDKDKRRLFLLSEGSLDPRSSLFKVLTPSEIKMREASAAQRRKLVQSNPSLHISLTRLAVRNIPRNVTSTELKALARRAVVGFAKDVKEGKREPLSKEERARGGEDDKESERQRKLKKKGIVRQAKIEFESKDGTKVPEKEGGSKSRGYGFIEYTTHRCALMGLRSLNGQQVEDEQGKSQRLIVEFAIENASVVARRKQAENKSRQQREEAEKAPASTSAPSSGEGRGDRGGPRRGAERGGRGNSRKGAERGGERGTPRKGSFAKRDGAQGTRFTKEEAGDGGKGDLQQKLIARKRLMRKKKANARGLA